MEGQPFQTIICIAVNQIAYPLPQGGRVKAGDSICLMAQVTIVGQDKELVNRLKAKPYPQAPGVADLRAYRPVSGHRKQDDADYNGRVLWGEEESVPTATLESLHES
jgi:hypothetical protein